MPQLLGKEVGPIGFGLMGLTWRPNPCPQEQAFATMRTALKNGSNLWNGGEYYGPPEYNSLVLLEGYFAKYPEDADKVVLSIKGCMNPDTHQIDGSVENTRKSLDHSIAQLKGRKKIDLFEFGRRDPNVPLKDTLEVIEKEYVQTGKIGGISLTEVRAETIHEAMKYTKILAVEVELSLFSTHVLKNGVAAACAEYGIPLIAYSPIGRGLLTGQIKKHEALPADSMLRGFPWFQPGNLEANLRLVQQVEEMAKNKNCTPAQLAINWTIALSKRPGIPTIIPIPGATTLARVEENTWLIELADEELALIDRTLADFTPAGERYPDNVPVNT